MSKGPSLRRPTQRHLLKWVLPLPIALGIGVASIPSPCSASPLSLVIETEHADNAKDCADQARLLSKVEQLAQRTVSASIASADSIHVVVRFARAAGVYRATLEFQGPKPGVRQLGDRSDSCEPLVDAVAVAIALLLDNELERRERAAIEVRHAAPTIRIIDSRVEPKRGSPSGIPWYLATEGGPQWGLRSTATAWFGLVLGVAATSGFALESSALAWLPSESRFDTGTVTVSLVAGAVRGCYLWGHGWRLGPCAAMALGRLRGSGGGFDESFSTNLFWAALGTSLELRRELAERWEVGLLVTTWVPLSEQQLSVENLGTAWNSEAIWLGAGVRLGVRFR